jgi:hypothetical protein
LSLSSLKESTLCAELRHDLLDQVAEDGHEHEDCEHLVSETLDGVFRFEK